MLRLAILAGFIGGVSLGFVSSPSVADAALPTGGDAQSIRAGDTGEEPSIRGDCCVQCGDTIACGMCVWMECGSCGPCGP